MTPYKANLAGPGLYVTLIPGGYLLLSNQKAGKSVLNLAGHRPWAGLAPGKKDSKDQAIFVPVDILSRHEHTMMP